MRNPIRDAARIGMYENAVKASTKYFAFRPSVQRERPPARSMRSYSTTRRSNPTQKAGRQDDDGVAPRVRQPGQDGRVGTEISRKPHDLNVRVLLRRFTQQRERVVPGTVVHEQQIELVRAHLLADGAQSLDERRQ